MSEKVKAVRCSFDNQLDVRTWLIEQGADESDAKEMTPINNCLYCVINNRIHEFNPVCSMLVDIVDLKLLKFKPFDKVLVREFDNEAWKPRFFSNYYKLDNKYIYGCTDGIEYSQCIPYEGNEHLCNKALVSDVL